VNGAFCGAQQFVALNNCLIDHGDFVARLWLPVATNGCGDYYLVDLTGPDQGDYPVFFWDHEVDQDLKTNNLIKGYAVASNVWIFSLLLLRNELRDDLAAPEERWHWPFDRDRTLQRDPDLARVTSAPLPWGTGN
jgi:hypothetical protein